MSQSNPLIMAAEEPASEEDALHTAPAPEESAPGIGPELIDGQWRPGQWHGLEMLTCTLCQWDTLNGIETARARRARCPRCAPAPLPARLATDLILADKWGNPMSADIHS